MVTVQDINEEIESELILSLFNTRALGIGIGTGNINYNANTIPGCQWKTHKGILCVDVLETII